MKRLSILFVAVLLTAIGMVPAMAGPSRAVVQEMGSTIGNDEVNVDVDWLPTGLNVVSNTTTASIGGGNGTIGGLALSSVNVGLADGLELRLGRLPGLKSYVSGLGNANNLGLTVKGAIPGVPGLAAWLGYGSNTTKDALPANNAGDTKGSSMRLGAAYTRTLAGFIVNGAADYGVDTAETAGVSGPDTKTTAVAIAAFYPLKPNILVGVEYHHASIDAGTIAGTTTKYTVSAPAIGARIIAGSFTIDAVAMLAANAKPSITGATLTDVKTTTIGVPTLRVNYKF